MSTDLPELHWAPYREFGPDDPATETFEVPAGPIAIGAVGYRGDDIIVYWEDPATWAQAVREFACPFCGRPEDRACRAEKDDIRSEPRDLIKPHGPRLRLLTEADPAVRGSFS
jgi:hypothetical protein